MSVIELSAIATEYRTIQATIKELEEQAETLKQSMIKEMDARQEDRVQAGAYEIRYALVESNRLDSTALKNALPDVYATYCKRTTSTRFQVA